MHYNITLKITKYAIKTIKYEKNSRYDINWKTFLKLIVNIVDS